jgi:hypothetical protein
MNQLSLWPAVLLLATASSASAQSDAGAPGAGSATYRCVDAAGRSTYTNVKEEMAGKKCTLVSREVSVVPGGVPVPPPMPARAPGQQPGGAAAKAPAPPNRVDTQTQRARDNDRRRILESELQSAEKQLAEARQKLAAQESIRGGDEKNYQRVLDRLKPFQDEVRGAEENVAALRREISNLR